MKPRNLLDINQRAIKDQGSQYEFWITLKFPGLIRDQEAMRLWEWYTSNSDLVDPRGRIRMQLLQHYIDDKLIAEGISFGWLENAPQRLRRLVSKWLRTGREKRQ